MMGDEAAKWFLRHHFRNHGLTVLRYFLKRGFMETLVKAYNICVTVVAQGHRHQLSIPPYISVYQVDVVACSTPHQELQPCLMLPKLLTILVSNQNRSF